MFISVTNILEPFLSSVIYYNRQEKCDVRLPWQQDLGISTHIFLDRDYHLHCQTIEQKYELLSCS